MYGYLLKKWRFIIQLFMFIQFLSQYFLVYHKEQMFVKLFVYLFENRAILFSLPQKKLTGYEYRSAFFLLLYFPLLCLSFLPLLMSLPFLPGARIISCPKHEILTVRSEPLINSKLSTSVSYRRKEKG